MASRYVPPALRKKAAQDGSGLSTASELATSSKAGPSPSGPILYTRQEIHDHFWPPTTSSSTNVSSDDKGNNADGECGPVDEAAARADFATLNGSAAVPDKLAYVMLFAGANPRWADDGIIFVKTHICLLEPYMESKIGAPKKGGVREARDSATEGLDAGQRVNSRELEEKQQQEDDSTLEQDQRRETNASATETTGSEPLNDKTLPPTTQTARSTSPVAVFEQARPQRSQNSDVFRFAGWHAVKAVDVLEPHSAELVRMLRQKWAVKRRDGSVKERERDKASWEDSLKRRWAVVRLVRDEMADRERGVLAIERRAEDQTERKGVNELLRELRMGGGGDGREGG